MKIKKNDTVLVIAGKDAGKTAKVLVAMPKANNHNKFNQFTQNDYDFDALEKELLSN